MSRCLVALALFLALVAAGCGGQPAPSATCTDGDAPILAALRHAPAPVTLSDGARLSDCVRRSTSDAELENLGAVVTRAADQLADGAAAKRPGAALALGYLVGAVRRGASHTNGIAAELVHRVEAAMRRAATGAGARVDLARGLSAGARTG